jgi:hypothetical protein
VPSLYLLDRRRHASGSTSAPGARSCHVDHELLDADRQDRAPRARWKRARATIEHLMCTHGVGRSVALLRRFVGGHESFREYRDMGALRSGSKLSTTSR